MNLLQICFLEHDYWIRSLIHLIIFLYLNNLLSAKSCFYFEFVKAVDMKEYHL